MKAPILKRMPTQSPPGRSRSDSGFVCGPLIVKKVSPSRCETTISQRFVAIEFSMPESMLWARQICSTKGESDCRVSRSKITQILLI